MSDLDQPFDYIIAGGGTAGAVLAARLTEDGKTRVLMIEAGGDRTGDPLIQTPGLVAGAWGREEYDWNFLSTPQPELNNRQISQAQGKGLGGSSAISFLMALYPSRHSMDAWAKLGNQGWDFDALNLYYRKFGTVHAPSASARDVCGMTYHDDSLGGDGPVDISFGDGYGEMNTAWMGAFERLGLRITADPRSGKAVGAFQNGATIDPKTKTRSFAQSAYLTPEVLERDNLVIVLETIATKIVFENQEGEAEPVATGVVGRAQDSSEKTFKAQREVIVTAGALQSPKLLELSGIGGQDLLNSLDIPVVVDNPNVGEHLQDHAIVGQSFEVNDDIPSGDKLRDPMFFGKVVEQYEESKHGPMGQSTISVAYAPLSDDKGPVDAEAKKRLLDEALAKGSSQQSQKLPSAAKETELLREMALKDDEPEMQYLLFPFQLTMSDKPESLVTYMTPSRDENYITIMSILNHPFSRGSCHITTSDPHAKPTWDPRYNSHPADLEMLARSVQFVERLASTPPLRAVFKPGGRRMPDTAGDTLEAAREVVRQRLMSNFHVTSSCAMLPSAQGGVVDERLRVYGVKGLRVADGSVFPLQPLGNIQTTVYAVAEKAADLIKEDGKS